MTSTEIIAIVSAVALACVQIITAWRTQAKVEAAQAVTAKHDAKADDKLDAIHELTNSNLTAVKTDLTQANDRIAKLEALLSERLPKDATPAKLEALLSERLPKDATPAKKAGT
jgi:hypothetical protein